MKPSLFLEETEDWVSLLRGVFTAGFLWFVATTGALAQVPATGPWAVQDIKIEAPFAPIEETRWERVKSFLSRGAKRVSGAVGVLFGNDQALELSSKLAEVVRKQAEVHAVLLMSMQRRLEAAERAATAVNAAEISLLRRKVAEQMNRPGFVGGSNS